MTRLERDGSGGCCLRRLSPFARLDTLALPCRLPILSPSHFVTVPESTPCLPTAPVPICPFEFVLPMLRRLSPFARLDTLALPCRLPILSPSHFVTVPESTPCLPTAPVPICPFQYLSLSALSTRLIAVPFRDCPQFDSCCCLPISCLSPNSQIDSLPSTPTVGGQRTSQPTRLGSLTNFSVDCYVGWAITG